MPLFSPDFVSIDGYPTIEPSLRLDFANARALDPRITFTRASTATYVGANGLIKTAGEDEARFDHDPATGESLGLLIEESRTNLITQSGDISQFSQATPNNQTLTANAAVAPDGTTTATRYTTNTSTGNNLQWIYKQFSGSYSNVTVTGSFWARGDATKTLTAHITDGIAGTSYNYTVTTEWQRFTFTKTQNTGAAVAGLYPVFISNEPAGLNIYLWGAQLEVGSFPTSYIPTSGSTATRSPDIASITGESFSSWYNETEGSLVFHGSNQADASIFGNLNGFVCINDGTSNTRIDFRQRIINSILSSNGTNVNWNAISTPPNITDITDSSFQKSGMAYSSNNHAQAQNGYLTRTSTTLLTPLNATRLVLFMRDSQTFPANGVGGHIKQLSYYPKRLTNAQLQTLTQ
jgi:hypothetical protein